MCYSLACFRFCNNCSNRWTFLAVSNITCKTNFYLIFSKRFAIFSLISGDYCFYFCKCLQIYAIKEERKKLFSTTQGTRIHSHQTSCTAFSLLPSSWNISPFPFLYSATRPQNGFKEDLNLQANETYRNIRRVKEKKKEKKYFLSPNWLVSSPKELPKVWSMSTSV